MMNSDHRHKHYVFQKCLSSLNFPVWRLQSLCLGRKGVCATHTSDTVTNPSTSAHQQASVLAHSLGPLQEEEPALSPTGFAKKSLLCFFPMSYRCIFTAVLHTQPQSLRNVHCKHPYKLTSHVLFLTRSFQGLHDHLSFTGLSLYISLQFWSNVKLFFLFSGPSQIWTALSRRRSTFVFIIWLFFQLTRVRNV